METVEDKKILVVGNPNYGLAQAFSETFKADFLSRSNGFDLSQKSIQVQCAEKSLNYDVFIICSSLYDFHQVKILRIVYEMWKRHKHNGQIICLGSTADTPVRGTAWIYPIEKKALKAYCRNLSLAALGGHGHNPPGIRVTYLSPGHIKTPVEDEKYPDVAKIDPKYLAQVVIWILSQPKEVNISEFALDPIQPPIKSGDEASL